MCNTALKQIKWLSTLKNYNTKFNITYYLNSSNTINLGAKSTYLTFNQGESIGQENSIPIRIPKRYGMENSFFRI